MPRKFLYPITTGRSGTVFLTKLLSANLPNATVYHERFGYQQFGINCPDASHSTTFNNIGNTEKVEIFWQQKLANDLKHNSDYFVEISHVLAKSGLVENLHFLPKDCEIHLIALKRDVFKILWSFFNRFDFFNQGFTWLFTLDSNYKNVIVNSAPFRQFGAKGHALWYIYEVFARMEYYRLLVAEHPNIHFHEWDLQDLIKPEGALRLLKSFTGEKITELKLPQKQNATAREYFGEAEKENCRKLIKKILCDPVALAKEYYGKGYRLGEPKHLSQKKFS